LTGERRFLNSKIVANKKLTIATPNKIIILVSI